MLQKHLKHLLALSVSTVLLAGGAVAAEQSAGKAENDFCLDKETFFRENTNFKDGQKVFAWYMVCCGPYNGGWDKKTRSTKGFSLTGIKSSSNDGVLSLGHKKSTTRRVVLFCGV